MMVTRNLLVVIGLVWLVGCSSTKTIRVAVPPHVDLRGYSAVGLVEFESDAGEEVQKLASQKFIESVQTAQPGTKFIELGPESQVLASTGRSGWDSSALRALKLSHGVDVVVVGKLDVEKAKPQVSLSTAWKKLSARSDVNVRLTARLLDTHTGATMWTDSAGLTTTIAQISVHNAGGSLGARDPQAVYGEMADTLVWEVTDDFRTHYVTRRVPKDHPQVADVRD